MAGPTDQIAVPAPLELQDVVPTGRLAETEGMARYVWAAEATRGRRVLDACCGDGAGTALLAASAASVTAFERTESTVEAARAATGDAFEIVVADPAALPFADGSFDAVCAFDLPALGDDLATAIGELARVLDRSGLALVAAPVDVAGEVQALLQSRFGSVVARDQGVWISSGIVEDAEARVQRTGAGRDDARPRHRLLVASDAGPVELPSAVALGPATDLDELTRRADELEAQLRAQQQRIDELDDRAAEIAQLRRELVRAERLTGRLPGLELERDTLRRELAASEASLEKARAEAAQVAELNERLARAESVYRGMQASLSWKVTRPLRAFKRLSG
jgi:SAM-dependent methyltransferase